MENTLKRRREQVLKLLNIPKIEQKTQEWYDARNNLITASDFAQALGHGKFGTQKQLIEKKVILDDFKVLNNPFFEWGNLFEPVACDIYACMHDAIVHEFGLIRHPKYNYFGASPDGITSDGIMLEIKCPFKRKITGEIPLQYYYQIQGQLDVCELEECDYFECEFAKYTCYDEYKNSYKDDLYTGIIKINNNEDKKTYEYMGVQKGMCNDNGDIDIIYWVLNKFLLKRVNKEENFVRENLKELKKVWDKILEYRKDRKKFELEVKNKISLDTEVCRFQEGKCMIINLEEDDVSSNKAKKALKKKSNKTKESKPKNNCFIVDLD